MLKTMEAAPTRQTDEEFFVDWRARELSRVDRAGLSYLDYTGSALYPESLVRADARRLEGALLGNPHSESGPSRAASEDMEAARAAILHYLRADAAEYTVVFTPNSTGGCRIVGESFPFSDKGSLVLTADNHNSVNGIREYAKARGAAVSVIAINEQLRLLDPLETLAERTDGASLFAFPAQSNFSGVRHPLELIEAAQARGYRVLLDAAAYVPSAELRLDGVSPDFVVLSLYKIAGYPSGVGALVARHEALAELKRPSFAGGTVKWVSVQGDKHRLIGGPNSFEDGTVPFLAVGAVPAALAAVEDAGRARLARHLERLTGELLNGLRSLRHRNGESVVNLLGPATTHARGATVAFTIQRNDGTGVPFWEVEACARELRLALRGGCFCNPGCAERAFGFPVEETAACLEELGEDFTIPKFAECLGERVVGALRISLGLGSVRADVERAVGFVAMYRE
jgi:selenocysteine lyase/cysteine desulfurase